MAESAWGRVDSCTHTVAAVGRPPAGSTGGEARPAAQGHRPHRALYAHVCVADLCPCGVPTHHILGRERLLVCACGSHAGGGAESHVRGRGCRTETRCAALTPSAPQHTPHHSRPRTLLHLLLHPGHVQLLAALQVPSLKRVADVDRAPLLLAQQAAHDAAAAAAAGARAAAAGAGAACVGQRAGVVVRDVDQDQLRSRWSGWVGREEGRRLRAAAGRQAAGGGRRRDCSWLRRHGDRVSRHAVPKAGQGGGGDRSLTGRSGQLTAPGSPSATAHYIHTAGLGPPKPTGCSWNCRPLWAALCCSCSCPSICIAAGARGCWPDQLNAEASRRANLPAAAIQPGVSAYLAHTSLQGAALPCAHSLRPSRVASPPPPHPPHRYARQHPLQPLAAHATPRSRGAEAPGAQCVTLQSRIGRQGGPG